MHLSLYRDEPSSEAHFQAFLKQNVYSRLQALDSRARRKGLEALDSSIPLVAIGAEVDAEGRVTKNGYGVFHLSWRAQEHPEWAAQVNSELEEIRRRIKAGHGCGLRFLVWAGMGGSAEDKSMYNAVGLLRKGPRVYVLDSTDPAKLKAILQDMQRRSRLSLAAVLKSTLVVGMAMGMTSYEPVVNLEKLHALYEKHRIDSRPNFIYMTLPGSLLDRFACPRGYRRVELQLDGGNSTAGRHSAPLTRGSLYPLGLAGLDLRAWSSGAFLAQEQVESAWRLASFLQSQQQAGRDKVTLLLPKPWEGAALWTKQDFEESLGKSEQTGIKIVIGEKPKLVNYLPPKDPRQQRVFLAVQVKGLSGPERQKVSLLRRRGYPVAVLTLPKGSPLSAYMQFVHYCVFGLGYLRNMNFVTQPSVELYKAITGRIHAEAEKAGGVEKCSAWNELRDPAVSVRFGGRLTLCYPHMASAAGPRSHDAAALYAALLHKQAASGQVEYGELTFFGDTRYSPAGRAVRKYLDRAAEVVFRSLLKMPVDVYEGPAMNHSYHEMIIGHGRCFSTVLLSEKAEALPEIGYGPGYHVAQFLATQAALAERGRPVVAIVLADLESATLECLEDFFRRVAEHLRRAV